MHHFGVPRRGFDAKSGIEANKTKVAQVQWRRGLIRAWMLASAAWMGWIVFDPSWDRERVPYPGEFIAIPSVDWATHRPAVRPMAAGPSRFQTMLRAASSLTAKRTYPPLSDAIHDWRG